MKRILLVDDSPVGIGALCVLLEMDGYAVVALQSSAEALEWLQRETFHAVVTDLEMPGVHGLDLVKTVRALAPETPIFIATGYAGSPASDAALALGARCVFPKPLRYEALLEELNRCLQPDSAPVSGK